MMYKKKPSPLSKLQERSELQLAALSLATMPSCELDDPIKTSVKMCREKKNAPSEIAQYLLSNHKKDIQNFISFNESMGFIFLN